MKKECPACKSEVSVRTNGKFYRHGFSRARTAVNGKVIQEDSYRSCEMSGKDLKDILQDYLDLKAKE